MGSTLKGKNLLLQSNFSPLRVNPTVEGVKYECQRIPSPESVHMHMLYANYTICQQPYSLTKASTASEKVHIP